MLRRPRIIAQHVDASRRASRVGRRRPTIRAESGTRPEEHVPGVTSAHSQMSPAKRELVDGPPCADPVSEVSRELNCLGAARCVSGPFGGLPAFRPGRPGDDGGFDFAHRQNPGQVAHPQTNGCRHRCGSGRLARRGGGDEGTRTPDPRDANAVLFQLSYIPTRAMGSLAQHPAGGPLRESLAKPSRRAGRLGREPGRAGSRLD